MRVEAKEGEGSDDDAPDAAAEATDAMAAATLPACCAKLRSSCSAGVRLRMRLMCVRCSACDRLSPASRSSGGVGRGDSGCDRGCLSAFERW